MSLLCDLPACPYYVFCLHVLLLRPNSHVECLPVLGLCLITGTAALRLSHPLQAIHINIVYCEYCELAG